LASEISLTGKSMRRFLCICVLSLCSAGGFAQDLSIAAAADLQFAFKDVAARFEKQTGHPVQVTFGSSGNFFAQIQNGAPFDLFFSADSDYPKKLEAAGLTEPGSFYSYAVGKIVLWAPKGAAFDVSRGLRILLDPSIKKIAIANPEHAPYGRAAVAALKHENLYDQVSSKFVIGENISQTATFVASGNADVGIIALSLALSPTMQNDGKYEEVPPADYPPLEQAAVILKSSKQKETGHEFIAFLKSPATTEIMRQYGFAVPKP
jgi:molybdate transport system substrate-binding protein